MKPINFDPGSEPKTWEEFNALDEIYGNHASRAEHQSFVVIKFPRTSRKTKGPKVKNKKRSALK